MIPHGEKMTNGSDRLSEAGLARAECLREIFGPGSVYNIGLILVPKYKFTRKSPCNKGCRHVTERQ